ncbi:MAG: pyruvate kinase [Alphaproteobacteria bacterium]|nr:MAG: pyruvate kinase [Alphaproteobacteria bacterium]
MINARKTKIIATLGPASSSLETIERLTLEGVNVFRLNFSHGTHEDHLHCITCIRKISKKCGKTSAILADLQGPKLRVGTFVKTRETLQQGAEFSLHLKTVDGTINHVQLPHEEIFSAIRPGDQILINDGRIVLEALHAGGGVIKTLVRRGGEISDHKGVNVPGINLDISAITTKDLTDLTFALSHEVDWVALSFVQSAQDVKNAKHYIQGRARILSKIEKPQALNDLTNIIFESDAVMVARGDLGVELDVEDVPPVQHRIIDMCRKMRTPVVVATQMLESMIVCETPTRAEVTDVAEAVYAGVDAVMLSAESASGKYPIESVQMMNRIIVRVEKDPQYTERIYRFSHTMPLADGHSAFVQAATNVTQGLSVKAIVCFSTSGATALASAVSRPRVPILCLTPSIKTANYVNLVWGVHGHIARNVMTMPNMVEEACAHVVTHGYGREGDSILITAGLPFGVSGPPNVLRLVEIGNTCTYE